MIKLILWEMDRSFAPVDPTERMKHTMTLLEMVKKGLAEGHLKMWGMNPGANHGFAVTDTDEKDIFATVAQYIPHVKFEVEPMLSVEEIMETLKGLQPQG